MRTLAILPIKSFSAAKQRLAGALGSGSRQALAQAMLFDVLASLRRVRSLEAIVVVTADPRAESAALGGGVRVVDDTQEAGQSAAAAQGISYALASGFDRVLLVPGDTPLVEPAELEAALAGAEREGLGALIVPDRHGEGTNALLLSPPDALAPAFGPGSRARHEALARQAGLRHRVAALPSLVLDVDTPDDLAALASALEGRRGRAPMTRGALAQLDRVQVRATCSATRPPPRAVIGV